MKWGVRRYQNKDGSLTSVGQKRKSGVDRDGSDYVGRSKEMIRKNLLRDDGGSLRLTKAGHEFEVARRQRLSPKASDNELRKLLDVDDETRPGYSRKIDSYVVLFNEIIDHSGDWYNGAPVSSGFKTAYEKYEKQKDKRNEGELLGAVLKDLGYRDTENNRNRIRSTVIWD